MTINTVLTNKLASQCDLAYRGLEVTCIWKAPEVLCTGIKRTYRYSYINRFDAMNTWWIGAILFSVFYSSFFWLMCTNCMISRSMNKILIYYTRDIYIFIYWVLHDVSTSWNLFYWSFTRCIDRLWRIFFKMTHK